LLPALDMLAHGSALLEEAKHARLHHRIADHVQVVEIVPMNDRQAVDITVAPVGCAEIVAAGMLGNGKPSCRGVEGDAFGDVGNVVRRVDSAVAAEGPAQYTLVAIALGKPF